jgi:DNA-binding MarR family transcriptional regulator
MKSMQPIEEVRYLILAAQREGNRFLAEALLPMGLTPSQAEVLRVLQDWQPLALIELGSLLVCEQGSPSRLVAGLVASGHIASEPSSEDKRKVVLTLTTRGREAARQVEAIESALYSALSAQVSTRQVEVMKRVLWKIVTGLPAGDALARRMQPAQLSSGAGDTDTTPMS